MTAPLKPERPRILFLYSDTGGGHRSAAEAIIEALQTDYGEGIETCMVDFFREYAPPPLDRMPGLYPQIVRLPQAWGLGFRLSNGHRRGHLLTSTFWPYVRFAAKKLVRQNPSDLIVSVHPLANAPILRALGKHRPLYDTVVTDLVTTHALWFHRRVDQCLVPTEAARHYALENGMHPTQVKVVGLPVAERFCQPAGDHQELRQRLGWPLDRPVVLLVGGGDGMGPIKRTALAISESRLPLSMVIVTGRNRRLQEELETISWNMPTFVYGFVTDMPDFMRAADILVTKAGPGTISEAFNAGLPMILYSRLPGQEDGNVAYVVSEGAGVWAPTTERIIGALYYWIYFPEQREKTAQACRRLARPQAAHTIARLLVQQVRAGAPVR